MRTVKFTKDWTFNLTGANDGRVSKKAGEVGRYPDHICELLVNRWKVARYHEMRPQETKPARPTETKDYEQLTSTEMLASEAAEELGKFDSIEQIEAFIAGDDRVTVQRAAEKRLEDIGE